MVRCGLSKCAIMPHGSKKLQNRLYGVLGLKRVIGRQGALSSLYGHPGGRSTRKTILQVIASVAAQWIFRMVVPSEAILRVTGP